MRWWIYKDPRTGPIQAFGLNNRLRRIGLKISEAEVDVAHLAKDIDGANCLGP